MNPNALYKGKPLTYELINMYKRGPLFKACIKVFVDFGLEFTDKIMLSVLMDDADSLNLLLEHNNSAIDARYSLDGTFTQLLHVSLMHVCAEYNHISCAKILVKFGADIDVKAGYDEFGFGGHTPIFHTVNQDANKSVDMLNYLISQKADLSVTVKGLIWGKGYEWETYIPSVNPISYAMMGLLRQFQRRELEIYEVVYLLMKAAYNIDYRPANIPNKYLTS